MELSREVTQANVVRAWEPGRVRIGDEWLHGHLIVAADRIVSGWPVTAADRIDFAALEPAIALEPEIILLGTGPDLVLPDVELMARLAAEAIGLEIMSTAAACRTYNVLVHERRRVVAALFNPEP
ncbi:MAG TPA: MTH938/NDUFAF3 family protein [Gammaproteobacteria bacterium]|nr:MTH938/NDUFAF3 family protein [Gammaproteobacteria bacterium]